MQIIRFKSWFWSQRRDVQVLSCASEFYPSTTRCKRDTGESIRCCWIWNRDLAECISRRMLGTKRNRWGRARGCRGHRPPPSGRGAICTFQVHTKARRGGRSFDRINLSVASDYVSITFIESHGRTRRNFSCMQICIACRIAVTSSETCSLSIKLNSNINFCLVHKCCCINWYLWEYLR